MGSVRLLSLVLVLGLFMPVAFGTVALGFDRVSVACHTKDMMKDTYWDWALESQLKDGQLKDGQHKYLEIEGFWQKSVNGDGYFLSDKRSLEELNKLCRDTISLKRGPTFFLTQMRARKGFFSSGYDIKFPIEDRNLAIRQIAKDLEGIFLEEFLPIAKAEMGARETTNVMGSLLEDYVKKNPASKKDLLNYVAEAVRYSRQPQATVEWRSPEGVERVDEFIDMFKHESDFSIFCYSFMSENGEQRRGPYNTFVDLLTTSFQPPSQKRDVSTPNLYQANIWEHRRTLAFANAFALMSALKGTLERVPLMKEDQCKEELNAYYSKLIETIEPTQLALKNLESYLTIEEQKVKFAQIEKKIYEAVLKSLQ